MYSIAEQRWIAEQREELAERVVGIAAYDYGLKSFQVIEALTSLEDCVTARLSIRTS